MKKTKILTALTLATTLLFTACNRDNDNLSPDFVSSLASATADESYAELETDFIASGVNDVFLSEGNGNAGQRVTDSNRRPRFSINPECTTVIRDTVNHILTITFDEEGCLGYDGKTRKGVIKVTYGEWIEDFGPATRTTTLEGYSVDENLVEGTHEKVWVSGNRTEGFTVHVSESGGKITFTDGTEITRTANWTKTISLSENPEEDTQSVEGTTSGTRKNGSAYTMETLSPILKMRSCQEGRGHVPVSGIKSFTITDTEGTVKAATLDFGDGSCDKFATLTSEGVSVEIELGKRRGGRR